MGNPISTKKVGEKPSGFVLYIPSCFSQLLERLQSQRILLEYISNPRNVSSYPSIHTFLDARNTNFSFSYQSKPPFLFAFATHWYIISSSLILYSHICLFVNHYIIQTCFYQITLKMWKSFAGGNSIVFDISSQL